MTNSHNILKLLKDILIKNKNLKESYSNIDELVIFFKYIIRTRENFNSAYLLNYLYQNISAKDVAKRKTTARDFEDYLAILFNGTVTDETKRQNSNNQVVEIENDFITDWVISNKREKADIIFDDNFALSVKTLMKNNKEINLGSFEKTALFYQLGVNDFLNERKGKDGLLNNEKVKIGLGSKTLLKNLLLLLKEKNRYDTFKTRFLKMAKEIFADDMLIAIKNNLEMDLYFIKSNDFYNLFENSIDDIDKFIKIINRWEGNSIRVDREEFLKIATHIKLNFDFLDDSILKYFTEFENKTIKILVKYINDVDNKEFYQKQICSEIEQIINLIEQKIKGSG